MVRHVLHEVHWLTFTMGLYVRWNVLAVMLNEFLPISALSVILGIAVRGSYGYLVPVNQYIC